MISQGKMGLCILYFCCPTLQIIECEGTKDNPTGTRNQQKALALTRYHLLNSCYA